MRYTRLLSLVGVAAAALACGDDDPSGSLTHNYSLVPPTPAFSVGQDSSVTLGIKLVRDGDDTVPNPSLIYTSSDVSTVRVSNTGVATGISGGSAIITVSGPGVSLDVPVEVRPYLATSVELSVLSGPAGGVLATTHDTGTFCALPAHAGTSRLRAVVRVGDTVVYCNWCTAPTVPLRLVRFRSLDETKATVSNANDPTATNQTSAGQVTPQDTTSEGVRIVLEVPGDGLEDTVVVKLKLRPIDTIRVRPDSAFFPSTNGNQGLQYRIWPNADTVQANIIASTTTNFNAGVTFRSRIQPLPNSFGGSNPSAQFIDIFPVGGVTVRRPNLPLVSWESANPAYLQINAAGAVVGPCAFIGGNCPSAGSSVLNCNSPLTGSMPFNFNGQGNLTIPNCNPAKTIPMPGSFCSGTSNTLDATCTIWVRATATDQATGKILQRLYRINVRL
jgi:hypothetical protein